MPGKLPPSSTAHRLRAAFVGLLAGAAMLALPAERAAAAAAVPAAQAPDPWSLCAGEILRAERELSIPRRLLSAIAHVESGRWNDLARASSAWPWTVMAEGRGRYLPSKAAAVAEVVRLWARGVDNVDVGCMQINLHHHRDAFDTLEEAFDPAANVAYGASFLRSLQIKSGSWVKAVGNYHSATPERHRRYRARVFDAWREERRTAGRMAAVAASAAPSEDPQSAADAVRPAVRGRPLTEIEFARSGPVAPGESS